MSLHLMWFWFRRGSMLWRATRHHWGDTNSQPSVSSHVPITLTLLHHSTHQHTAFALLSQIRLSCNITKQWVINIGVSLSLSRLFFLTVHVCITSFLFCGLSVWPFERRGKSHTAWQNAQIYFTCNCYSSFSRFHDGTQTARPLFHLRKYVVHPSFSFTQTTLN